MLVTVRGVVRATAGTGTAGAGFSPLAWRRGLGRDVGRTAGADRAPCADGGGRDFEKIATL